MIEYYLPALLKLCRLAEAVRLLASIRDLLVRNIGPDFYSLMEVFFCGITWLKSALPDRYQGSASKRSSTVSFHVLSNSLFTPRILTVNHFYYSKQMRIVCLIIYLSLTNLCI